MWSEEDEEFIIIPETVTTRSSGVAGSTSTVALHWIDYFLLVEVVGEVKVGALKYI